jgi:hypothetical protein
MASTTNYSWSTPDDTALVKDGASAIRTLGSSVDTTLFNITNGKNTGLVPISTTTFSGVASVSVDNVFTSAYKNYRIVVNGSNGASTPTRALFRIINTSGSVVSAAGSYRGGFYYWRNTASAAGAEGGTNSTAAVIAVANSYGYCLTIDIAEPFSSSAVLGGLYAGFDYSSVFNGFVLNNTAARGFQLLNDSGTMAGEIRVYGYRNS